MYPSVLIVRATFIVTALVCASAASPCQAIAQESNCENGIVKLPYGVNGTIQVCPTIAAQAPTLQRQIDRLRTEVRSQNAATQQQLIRILESLNNVSLAISNTDKVTLARSVSRRFANNNSLAQLSDQLYKLNQTLLQGLLNPTTASRIRSALRGHLGTDIANLNFRSAQRQLNAISMQLVAIRAEVTAVHSQTTTIVHQTASIQHALAQQAAARARQERAGARYTAAMEKEQLADPYYFASPNVQAVNLEPDKPALTVSADSIFGDISPDSSSSVFITLRETNGATEVVRPIWDEQFEYYKAYLDMVPDSVVVCIRKFDTRTHAMREVTSDFTFEPDEDAADNALGATWAYAKQIGKPKFVQVEPPGTCAGAK